MTIRNIFNSSPKKEPELVILEKKVLPKKSFKFGFLQVLLVLTVAISVTYGITHAQDASPAEPAPEQQEAPVQDDAPPVQDTEPAPEEPTPNTDSSPVSPEPELPLVTEPAIPTLVEPTLPETATDTDYQAPSTSSDTDVLETIVDTLKDIGSSIKDTLSDLVTPTPSIEEGSIASSTAPILFGEQDTETGKLVTVSSPEEDLNNPHTNVLASTTIPEIYKVGEEDKIQIKWTNNGDQEMSFHAYDTDNNGKLDLVEWTIPHLSTQIFEIIFISKAFHLDQDKNIIADIYDTVKTQDGTFASLTEGQYARVTFEKILDNTKDITVYARAGGGVIPAEAGIQSASLEVFPLYDDGNGNLTQGSSIATFGEITTKGTYKVLLSNLQTPTDRFDIRVSGSIEIDLVIDPIASPLFIAEVDGAIDDGATFGSMNSPGTEGVDFPGATDDVDVAGFYLTASGSVTVNTITDSVGGSSLTINADLTATTITDVQIIVSDTSTITADISWNVPFPDKAIIVNSGARVTDYIGTLTNIGTGYGIYNAGFMTINSTATITNTGGGTSFANYGTVNGSGILNGDIKVEGGSTLDLSGGLLVYGTITNNSGTITVPTTITSWTQLNYMRYNLAGSYTLANDLTTSDLDYAAIGGNWTPVGSCAGQDCVNNAGTPFTGSFDGGGYVMQGLTVSLPSNYGVGLFANTSGATISNIVLTGVSISGYYHVGGLVGYQNGGSITGSNSSGTVTGGSSGYYTGGLVGYQNSSASITNSSSTVTVTGGSSGYYTGGFVGYQNNSSSITNSYSTGSVVDGGGNYYNGGLVGYQNNSSSITNSYSTGSVSGYYYVGGLVGSQEYSSSVTNSYSTGSVSGYYYVGGLVGSQYYYSTITNSYSAGNVYSYWSSTYGGLVGSQEQYSTISNSFWDTQTSGRYSMCGQYDGSGSGCNNSKGRNSADMKKLYLFNSFFGINWDIIGGQNDNNNGYPYLSMGGSNVWYLPDNTLSPFANGDGSPGNPYQITTWIGLDAMRYNLAASYILNNDLTSTSTDYAGIGGSWTPVGNCGRDYCGSASGNENIHDPFTGTFDGGGYVIQGLTINLPSTDYVGLFGYTPGATISNIGLTDVNVTGRAVVGGLVGQAENGSITNSYSTGSVTGSSSVGGLAGTADYSSLLIANSYSEASVSGGTNVGGLVGISYEAHLANSYATGDVTGTGDNVGGLVGISYGTNPPSISDSYATGIVSSTGNYVGGLAGYSHGPITNSYSTGSVSGSIYVGGLLGYNYYSSITSSFFNTETSLQTVMCGDIDTGTGCDDSYGLTTAEMSTILPFLETGWNIGVGTIDPNIGSPYLGFQEDNNTYTWLSPDTSNIWTNYTTDNNWNNTANWLSGTLPVTGEEVYLIADVTLPSDVSGDMYTLVDNLTITGGGHTLTGVISAYDSPIIRPDGYRNGYAINLSNIIVTGDVVSNGQDNNATGYNPGYGGAITITDSTIQGNIISNGGNDIIGNNNYYAGNGGTISLTNSSFANITAQGGTYSSAMTYGGYGGTVTITGNTLDISNSTINLAGGLGDPLFVYTNGENGSLTLTYQGLITDPSTYFNEIGTLTINNTSYIDSNLLNSQTCTNGYTVGIGCAWNGLFNPLIFYFNNAAGDGDWNNLLNWWNDVDYTDPAELLPTTIDQVFINGALTTLGIGDQAVADTIVFNGTSTSVIDITVTQDVTFNDESSNSGTLTIGGTATFNDSSSNTGTITANTSTFFEDLTSTVGGTVVGFLQRIFTSSATTTRDFTTEGGRNDWTIISTGVNTIVDLSAAVYDLATNLFKGLLGGTFVSNSGISGGTSVVPSVTITSPIADSIADTTKWLPNIDWGTAVSCQYSDDNYVTMNTLDCLENGADIPRPSAGQHTLYIRATDNHGGITENSVTYTYDNTVPTYTMCGDDLLDEPRPYYFLSGNVAGDCTITATTTLKGNILATSTGYTVTGNIVGNGNNINLQNITVTGTVDSDNGNIILSSGTFEGDINSDGGNITITNSILSNTIASDGGTITTTGSTLSDTVNSYGGTISFSTTIASATTTSEGGNITISNSTTTSVTSSGNSNGENAGSINIATSTTGILYANGANGTANGGNGGDIAITNSIGTNALSTLIYTNGGNSTSCGNGGDAGLATLLNSTYGTISAIGGASAVSGCPSESRTSGQTRTPTVQGVYTAPSTSGGDTGGNSAPSSTGGSSSGGGSLRNLIKNIVKPLDLIPIQNFTPFAPNFNPTIIGSTLIPDPFKNFKAPGVIDLTDLPSRFLTNISKFLFAPIPQTLNDVLTSSPRLGVYVASIGLTTEQEVASLALNPVLLKNPASDETTPAGFFIIRSGEQTITTYATYDKAAGGLAQLVKTSPNQSLSLSLIPQSTGPVSATYLNQTLLFTQGSLFATAYIQTPTNPGRYIINTTSSPLPLLIEVIAPPQIYTAPAPKPWGIFNFAWNWFR